MSLNAKQIIIAILSIAIIVVLGYVVFTEKEHVRGERKIVIKSDSAGCVKCHGQKNKDGGPGNDPGVVKHWESSVHAEQGVGCIDCHGVPKETDDKDIDNPRYMVKVTGWTKQNDLKKTILVMENGKPGERKDIWNHEGADIVTAVSPRTCARCHKKEMEQFYHSRHSSAAQFIGSIDNFLGRYVEGPAAANNGCQQCHGSFLTIEEIPPGDNAPLLNAGTWPNTGMGRVNLDGSWGACSSCHSRHEFSAEVARRPDNCGKCHMGPDHPQIEIYYESKHGVAYRKNEGDMKMDLPGLKWVLGKDYAQAPTCSSCHMGPVAPHGNYRGLEMNHDAGSRISWTLRPKVSSKPKGLMDGDKVIVKDPEGRRTDMKEACLTCHSKQWVNNFYVQFDNAVELYNNKYGKPSTVIYEFLKKEKIIDSVPMNEEMDYLYFELWHHEGRRARHGASMMGPDYVQWHGFYELSKHFYTHFLPLAKELGKEKGKGKEVEEFIKQTLHSKENGIDSWKKYHKWQEGLSAEQKTEMEKWEQKDYGSE